MLFSNPTLLATVGLISCAAGIPPVTPPTLGADPFIGLNLPQNAYGASVLAYLYSSPLQGFDFEFGGGKAGKIGINKVRGGRGLHSGATGGQGIKNTDTIYGEGLMDLAATDLVLTVPPMQNNRYYSFSFYDVYGDDFAVISTVNEDPSGRYLIRPTLNEGLASKTTQNCKGYTGCINSPTLNLFMLIRVLILEPNNQSDITYAQKFIKSSKFTEVNKHKPTAPPLGDQDFTGLSANRVTKSFQLAARLAARNPPQDPLFATFLPFTLSSAGISGGKYTPTSADLSKVEDAFDKIVAAFIANPVNNIPLNNGWTVDAPAWDGSFEGGTNIVARALIARGGYPQNTAAQSLYLPAPQHQYTLAKDQALIFTFSRKPPLQNVGFWSLTLYLIPGGLFDNPQNVNALGDRSNLTYPDGSPVYRGGDPTRDGPFQLLVQPFNQPPPKNWTGNWLPAPVGQPFKFLLRLYAAKLDQTATQNAPYTYPKVVQRKAIK